MALSRATGNVRKPEYLSKAAKSRRTSLDTQQDKGRQPALAQCLWTKHLLTLSPSARIKDLPPREHSTPDEETATKGDASG